MNSQCMCGHVEDEHGHDPDYPGSTACTIKGCDCVAFDPDVEVKAAPFESFERRDRLNDRMWEEGK